jgi:hypothetical protein
VSNLREYSGDAADRLMAGMMQSPLIDLASQLLPRLRANLTLSLSEQIAAWQAYYDLFAPDLPPRLYAHYREVEGGWYAIAESHIFPKLPRLLAPIETALTNLHTIIPAVNARTSLVLPLARPPVVVGYVGLGNGAGWATVWRGQPAILVGLENVANLGWESTGALEGLLAHESGHLFMMQIRGDIEAMAEDPYLALYSEGFAQHCEHLIMGRESWHCSSQNGWLQWCMAHERDLARMYLDALNNREEWRKFFGSWFDVEGWRQTGYFLGCRFVCEQSRDHGLVDLAAWTEDRIREVVGQFLKANARSQ